MSVRDRVEPPLQRDAGHVLVLLGHPRGTESFCGALARAYAAGAHEAGRSVEVVDCSTLDFDANLHAVSPRQQALEPDLARLRDQVETADHIVIVAPTWWGGPPALLKGLLDRLLVPGWAFEEIEGGTGYQGLLTGRTGELILTMDTPPIVYRLIYRAPGANLLSRCVLGFCGIDVARTTLVGPVKDSSDAWRATWLSKVEALGLSLREGAFSPSQRIGRRLAPWFKAMRLQFYPMTLISYWVGALSAPGELWAGGFALGLAALFALEAATVFSNDLHDLPSDRANRRFGPFTGGSRVLTEGLLKPAQLARGAWIAGVVSLLCFLALCSLAERPAQLSVAAAALAVLALGYTIPPLKLSWRGLGEATVVLTHSFGVMVFGAVAQGAALSAPSAWLLAAPLALAVAPAILMAGAPDSAADAAAGKRTLAVRLGVRRVLLLAAGLVAASAALGVALSLSQAAPALHGLEVAAPLHAAFLIPRIMSEARKGDGARRMDGLIANGLTYILWFGVIPLINLL